ncbi:hypothetical protein EXIGLDRAFT_769774 [Exidia glandulosa HHB12029]|uniref:Uncharacterized protein n=1 Tax=Exidia glandulosa HHB12029 TaxID=1314781 RepID=A0A166AG18_EXIGL|nr:hypothetical protein EXIGLDRAFT_769774 [Exidia glandulosa HHB12029]
MDTGSSKVNFDRNQNDFHNPWIWPHDVLPNATVQDVALGTWINLVGRVRNITEADLSSHERLGNLSRDVFEEMFPYIALDAYGEPSTQRLNGTRTVVEQRLVVKDLSIRLVQSALCVLAAIALALYILRPVTHLSGDPDSIIASATILAASHGLVDYLASTSAAREREFDARLRYTTCYTRPGDGGAAAILYASESDRVTDGSHVPLDVSRSSESSPVAFWQPFMLSLPAKAIMLGLVAVCVIGLELTLGRSQRDGGLVDIATQNSLSQHGIPYVAPAVLFVLGLVLASFDFAIRVTEPFRRLAAAPRSAGALGFNPTFAGEYATVSHAIRRREYTVLLAASTSVFTLICKIVVAGLIFNGAKDGSVPLDLKLESQFD